MQDEVPSPLISPRTVLLTSFGEEGVTYCVKPNSTAECIGDDCQRCETFQYYCDNVDTIINQNKNVTMIFMSGTHTLYLSEETIKSPTVYLIGRGQNVTVTVVCPDITCSNTDNRWFLDFISDSVSIESLHITGNGFLSIIGASQAMIKNCLFQSSSVVVDTMNAVEVRVEDSAFLNTDLFLLETKVMLKTCKFQDINQKGVYIVATIAILEDCHLQNSFIKIEVDSQLVIRGGSKLDACTANVINSASTLSGKVSFSNNYALGGGAIFLFNSTLNFAADADIIFSNNTALDRGGALYLSSTSKIFMEPGANVSFINNSAHNKGGAIYIETGNTATSILFTWNVWTSCFYHLLNCNDGNAMDMISISFANNSAVYGGDDIYGASLDMCSTGSHPCKPTINRDNLSISSVSSDPLRVCICDSRGKPQCNNSKFIYKTREVHPGEIFTIDAVLVGWDYGTTTGLVYAQINSNLLFSAPLLEQNRDVQLIENIKQCTTLSYSLNSNSTQEKVIMYIAALYLDKTVQDYLPGGQCYHNYYKTNLCSHMSPILFNITILPCPSGYYLLNQRCNCYLHHVLFDNCSIINGTGYFSWSIKAWASIYNDTLLYKHSLPFPLLQHNWQTD